MQDVDTPNCLQPGTKFLDLQCNCLEIMLQPDAATSPDGISATLLMRAHLTAIFHDSLEMVMVPEERALPESN